MLCPEVWTFSPPNSTFKERFGNVIDNNIAVKEIQDFHYNHLVRNNKNKILQCLTNDL